MLGGRYCEPCKRLLCGKAQSQSEDSSIIQFIHHFDANSFKEALRLPCLLCSFGWNAEVFSLSWQESISHGTEGVLYYDDDDLVLRFYYDRPKGFDTSISLVPWEGRFFNSLLDTYGVS